ncbi:MAG TPA: GntG family PLP-dependent aldolase [Candidatus Hydrogenedentes bacterium]|nr:MAG: L-allo-threonine aldolase [Candidatus Hydrogenedentes bacterium ADurb.Bin170]HOD95663.1 GntG family PLP-dependent aldolase [Candidatus Hydrogenedentota bacterium]HOM47536.1 GntG family PLP-dependent aldolase [Candidatus Hydrogenedentota bacterium]HOR50402.1 GntG family PLP-dependent aldolase [Candidatus Hydrogenedentota bacterium]HPK23724.1 GntG family PLP-dependent aldolase [Candidatus Hydrogenedentota bacterium]
MDMIELRSDTFTCPSPAMRKVMADAEVGDDVYGEDPTVRALESKAAELIGKESALFLPSGTMANLVAFLAQTRPSDTVILSESAHPFHYENANLAMIGGLLVRTIPDPLGKFSAEQVQEQIVSEDDPHLSKTTMVSVENTTNRGGGACWDYHELEAVFRVCQESSMRLHCDGARIFHACIETNIQARYYGRCCDTLSFCLSKGLGAPAGSLLTGSTEVIKKALRFRKMLGGGMRQAGVLAAAGLYALEHHLSDLAEDHRRARECRRALENEGVVFALPSPTNILYIQTANAALKVKQLEEAGVRALAYRDDRIRVVFHRDISDALLSRAIEVFKKILVPA